MAPSSFDKFEITTNQLPDNPSQITAFTFPVDGGNTFKCWKVGKLYFGVRLDANPDNGISSNGSATTDSADRLASLIGETVNTIYTTDLALNAGLIVAWNGSTWASSGSSAVTLMGFLIN